MSEQREPEEMCLEEGGRGRDVESTGGFRLNDQNGFMSEVTSETQYPLVRGGV